MATETTSCTGSTVLQPLSDMVDLPLDQTGLHLVSWGNFLVLRCSGPEKLLLWNLASSQTEVRVSVSSLFFFINCTATRTPRGERKSIRRPAQVLPLDVGSSCEKASGGLSGQSTKRRTHLYGERLFHQAVTS
ncbi:membrane-bound O-acyltransferase domain-containing protein 2 [Tachysurus ichikawai]